MTESIVDHWIQVVDELGPGFAKRAAGKDLAGAFVAENYTELKERKIFSAAVPAELGGGGASHGQICQLLRRMSVPPRRRRRLAVRMRASIRHLPLSPTWSARWRTRWPLPAWPSAR